MAWYNPFSWGQKDLNQFRTDLDTDPRLQDARRLRNIGYGGLANVNRRPDIEASPEFRQRQLDAADRIYGVMTGGQQGAGELAVQRQGARAQAQQLGVAAMGRGGNAALAARDAARNVGNIGVDIAGQAQQAALQDQQAAAGQFGQIAGTARSQDIQDAGLLAQQRQANDQARLQYMAQLFGISNAEMEARLNQDRLRVQQNLGLAGTDTSGWGADLMNLSGQVTAAAVKSDRTAKKNIKREVDVDSMLARLKPYSYDYKNPKKDGEGKRHGVMAQDLEKSSLGKEMVKKTTDGLVVDYGQGLSTMMASIARIHERLQKVEAK